jgi:type IV pilus assembly protein PilQ
MGNNMSLNRKGISFLIYLAIGVLAISGCTTPSTQPIPFDEAEAPVVESIRVNTAPEQIIVEIVNNKTAPYVTFQLMDPPKVILDIQGRPGTNLPKTTQIDGRDVKEIRIEEVEAKGMTTRVAMELTRSLSYRTEAVGNIIKLTLGSKGVTAGASEMAMIDREEDPADFGAPKKPRIFFKPRSIDMNQVLGVDFTMFDRGKSRLIVTTDKKVPYQLERKGPMTLQLNLADSTIPPLLMRRLESTYFAGAVDRVKATLVDSQVSLAITLREMVPFHVKQEEHEISIDFGPTSIKPPEKKIVPLTLAEGTLEQVIEVKPDVSATPGVQSTPDVQAIPDLKTETNLQPKPNIGPKTETVAQFTSPIVVPTAPRAATRAAEGAAATGAKPVIEDGMAVLRGASTGGAMNRTYTGVPMTMDFVNANVTNILRLIAEVSNLNIVWGPNVKGNVSMRLKNVPWDQALDLVLANNNLGMRHVGNVIWITTKAQLVKLQAEERRRKAEYEAALEKNREAEKRAKMAAKALEPLVTEYLPVDFAKADEIKVHIVLSDRGSMSVDARTNTIIIKDIAEVITEAKKIAKQFDTPVKQIMIEARLVDATDTFTRDLGVRWGNTATGQSGVDARRRSNTGVPFTTPPDATGFTAGSDSLVAGTLSTNSPIGWISNLGIDFGYLTGSTLGALNLDANLALAEAEGYLKIISAPKVIASNGESATINRGTTFYLEAAENVEPKEVTANLSLEVTPTVSFNNYVTMDVTVKDEQRQGFDGKTGKDLTTKLMVKSGDTIVIGGIYTENNEAGESGIPYLKDVPILGWLFKADKKTLSNSELLIFLTPTVLPPPG